MQYNVKCETCGRILLVDGAIGSVEKAQFYADTLQEIVPASPAKIVIEGPKFLEIRHFNGKVWRTSPNVLV